MTTSPDTLHEAQRTPSLQATKGATATISKQKGPRKAITVSWYGRLLIVGTLLLAAAWEIFRWIMVVITFD